VRHLVITVEATFTDRNIGTELQDMPDEESMVKRQEKLASAFYAQMQDCQDFERTGDYRQGFFKKVIKVATRVSFPLFIAFHD
jgi:hypothetical protein